MLVLAWSITEWAATLAAMNEAVQRIATEHPEYTIAKNALGNYTIHDGEFEYIGLIEPAFGQVTFW